MMIGRKGAAHDGAGGGKVDRKLVRDRAMLDVRDAFRRQQGGKDVAVLPRLARGQRRKRANRKAEVEGDAIEVTRADACARQDEQAMLLQKLAQFVDDGENRVRAAIHDRASANLHHLNPGQEPDGTSARDGTGQIGIEQGLARERRGDMLGRVRAFGHLGLTSR